MTLEDRILVVNNNGFLSLKILGDSKTVINCFNKVISVLLYYDINKIYLEAIRDLNIYSFQHIYNSINKLTELHFLWLINVLI